MNFETSVREIIQRTADVKSFRFDRPQGFEFKAGQWMYVNIRIEGTSKLHHFTISASPTENYLEFTKKITDHPYSQALDQMKGGEWIKINGPYGDFVYAGENLKLGFLTGGIGITPMRSMLKYIADKNLKTDVKMLYSNKTAADIVFKDELDAIAREHPNIKISHVLTREPDWKGLKGHVDAKMIREQIPDYSGRTFYICGPPAMNEALSKALRELAVPDEQIRLEDFTGY
ncbi:ferredoxin--NADP reductase [Methanocella arvoryzae]|uniref:Predicted oxidoreductase FAD/NAD(P)-binding component n=1 Tax=Methanocella arvoryzae (strain DSM 22066 / NBRC 105507 / MRE50) TaxID=351160 RepID=Q0W8X3_METAR|nr:FAD-dependent oxidoreductase [Methanocella arvoryzae]CAJ35153.1 predicted oxidoreductase FAD/NAD(P)-binding component [Methanocella arvoryzae MRE50]